MNNKYFCPYHVEKIKSCETTAVCAWGDLMRRGVAAYIQCKVEDADLSFNSALEVSLLRLSCPKNSVFKQLHVLKPLGYLMELMIVNERFNDAMDILLRISAVINEYDCDDNDILREHMNRHYKRLESHELEMASITPTPITDLLDMKAQSAPHCTVH